MPEPTNTQFAVGVHLLTLLAAAPAGVHASTELAASVGTNPVHVRRVLGRLRRAGLVASRAGAQGGWALRADPARVTLRAVWDAVAGVGRVLGVHEAAPGCAVGRRIQAQLEHVERRAAAALAAELDGTTLADVLRAADAAGWPAPEPLPA
jgi:Rrf2 family protein